MNKYKAGQTDRCTIDRCVDRETGGWKDRWKMNGQIDERKEGQMDG